MRSRASSASVIFWRCACALVLALAVPAPGALADRNSQPLWVFLALAAVAHAFPSPPRVIRHTTRHTRFSWRRCSCFTGLLSRHRFGHPRRRMATSAAALVHPALQRRGLSAERPISVRLPRHGSQLVRSSRLRARACSDRGRPCTRAIAISARESLADAMVLRWRVCVGPPDSRTVRSGKSRRRRRGLVVGIAVAGRVGRQQPARPDLDERAPGPILSGARMPGLERQPS